MKLETLDDIKDLIASDTETDKIEFKESTGQLERGMETLCAFLNKEGGTVLFGINDRKKIIGQEVADTTKRNIADAISRLEPAAAVQILTVTGKSLPCMWRIQGLTARSPTRGDLICGWKALRPRCRRPHAIYDDRVEIENPGAFPHDWDMEKMKSEHCSEPQNPLIATILYKRKMLENWGRGISLMMDECQKAGLPEPEYRLGNGFVVLVFRYGENNRISTVQVPHKYHISTTQVQSLLEIVGNATLSVKEIMDLLQLKNRSYFSKEYLKPALETGLLEPIYPEQPSHPKQKYRLTDKGKKSLNRQ